MPEKREDNFTKAEAYAQVKFLRAYWRRRGYEVELEVVPLAGDKSLRGKKRLTGFTVKSDMVNGMPRDMAATLTAASRVAKGAKLVL